MKTEYLIFNNGRHRYVVKEVSKHDPYILIAKLFLALIVKSINLSNSSGLVIASSKMNPFWIPNFQGYE